MTDRAYAAANAEATERLLALAAAEAVDGGVARLPDASIAAARALHRA